MIDLSELWMIVQVLSGGEWMTTKEISEELRSRFGHRIGFKVTQNYLQSVLKQSTQYDPSSYKYRLRNHASSSLPMKSNIYEVDNKLAPIMVKVQGKEFDIKYDKRMTINMLLEAIVEISFSNPKVKLIRELNYKIFEKTLHYE